MTDSSGRRGIPLTRRAFIGWAAGAAAVAGAPRQARAGEEATVDDALRTFLENAAYRKEDVDRFLDPEARNWAQFDPELGYILRSYFMRDGVDGAYTLCTFGDHMERRMVNFADQPCRINTYGNSFTQCHQVSDGETWQETLAAHFGEPIRNFGIGGHGVYQAWRRMLREEANDAIAAPYVVINFWGDDHQRSINAWRWLTYHNIWEEAAMGAMFHGNPWSHARLDPDTGDLVEIPNPFDTPESLYQLCDPEFVHETFRDDPVVRILAAFRYGGRVDPAPIVTMAETVGLDLDWSTPEAVRDSAHYTYNVYAWRVTEKLVDRMKAWAEARDKELLVLLSYPEPQVRAACEGSDRDSTEMLDWHPKSLRTHMTEAGIRWFDTLPAHEADFRKFGLNPAEYTARYYIGHYNPTGNHFFAYAIKDELVDWLDPKPPTYRGDDEALIRFRGYLPG